MNANVPFPADPVPSPVPKSGCVPATSVHEARVSDIPSQVLPINQKGKTPQKVYTPAEGEKPKNGIHSGINNGGRSSRREKAAH
jgi:hypothetical protein